jgi:L-lysine exporter family protein LysE/ArgO
MTLALLRGIVLGFVAGIPIGPVNAAVIDTAIRKCFRRAMAIGVGGAFVDFVYSQIAFLGLGALFAHEPELANVLLAVGGMVLIVFGAVALRAPPVSPVSVPNQRPVVARALLAAFATGVLITIANPAALVSWVLLAGTVLSGMTKLQAFVAGIGIFIGTTLWFLIVAWLATRGRMKLGQRSVLLTRGVGLLLVAYGIFLVGKASVVVWASRF